MASATGTAGSGSAAVEVCGIHKRYGDTVAVRDVSLRVEPGEIFGILGPNGAGKTTTVECIIGLRVPDAGSIRVFGLDPRADRDMLHAAVGVQLQDGALPDQLSVDEIFGMYRSFYYDHPDEDLLGLLGLGEKRRTWYRNLSGGQKQRLALALALVGAPRLAVLDEMTAGLDPQARHDVWDLVRRTRDRGATILLVTHFMDEAERLCDRVAFIDQGSVVAVDTPAALAGRAAGSQRIHFVPSAPFDDALLTALPEVERVERDGSRVLVTGTGDLLRAVVVALSAAGVSPADLTVESATLEDAFLRLSGHRFDHATGEGRP